jgi:hypothetical protein
MSGMLSAAILVTVCAAVAVAAAWFAVRLYRSGGRAR